LNFVLTKKVITKRGVGLAISFSLIAAVLALSTPQIAEGDPEGAHIDVAASHPLVVTAGSGAITVPFSVACGMPVIEDPCDVRTVLHYKPAGGRWTEAIRLLDGLGVRFHVPLADTLYVDYYLEATERTTGTHMTFPSQGSTAPFRFYLLPSVGSTQLDLIPFGESRQPNSTFSLAWGPAPGQAGLLPGNESSTIGPQALDVDSQGNIYLLDQINDRVQVFDPNGVLVNAIPMELGPLGDLVLRGDGSFYILDFVPRPGSHPVVHHVTPASTPFAPPASVSTVETPEWEPALLRVERDVLWTYGTPSDAWQSVGGWSEGLAAVQMGMPSMVGELIRRIDPSRQVLELATPNSPQAQRIRVRVPDGRLFGELALVEPDDAGGFWVVVRTWQETPTRSDHHEVVRLSSDGRVLEHFALSNGEFADTGSMSQYRLGGDGDLYQIFTDDQGVQVRRFEI
jgi:hypothetical protein